MTKSQNIQHHDPVYARWKKKYPKIPSVADCLRIMWAQNTRGPLREAIHRDLVSIACSSLPEFISTYNSCATYHMRASIIHAIDEAKALDAIDFLERIAATAPAPESVVAFNALKNWNVKEARMALHRLEHRNQNSS